MRLVFMGTPQFAVPHLAMLAESGHEIAAVVTRPDRPAGRGQRLTPPPVKSAAEVLGLPVLQPASLKDAGFRAQMEALRPDLVCVVAYGGLLPPWLLELPAKGCVNVHPSLLPRYRGAAPIQRAIMNGDAYTGVTTMYMAEAMDAGDIILQEQVAIGKEDDAGTLHDRLAEVGARLLRRTVDLIAAGTAPRVPQDEALVTYAPKIGPDDERIDWSAPADAIDAAVRALRPSPGAYTVFGERRVKIWRTVPLPAPADGRSLEPGQVAAVDDEGIIVQTGGGMLKVLEVQPENGRRISAAAFVNGYRLAVGDRFGV